MPYDMTIYPPELAVNMRGELFGRLAKTWTVLGRRSVFNSVAYQDCAAHLAAVSDSFTEMNGTESLEVVSSSAADAAAGNGVRQLRIVYINTDYAIASALVTMNGTTPVQLIGVAMLMPLFLESYAVGSGAVAAGNIDLRTITVGTIHEQIQAGGNRSMSARFMIPDGWVGFVSSWDIHAINQSMDARFRATCSAFERDFVPGVYIFQGNAFVAANTGMTQSLPWLKFPARSKLKISAIPGATTGSPRLETEFSVILVKGDA